LIFIEIALGLEILALIHFAGNAFLRTYQLLVSPSVVTYLIREQFYSFVPRSQAAGSGWWYKLQQSLYVLSVKEWNLDTGLFHKVWSPLKKVGRSLVNVPTGTFVGVLAVVYLLGLYLLVTNQGDDTMRHAFPITGSLLGLMVIVRAFAERKHPTTAFTFVIFNHLWLVLAISFNEAFTYWHSVIYLSGVAFSGMLGIGILRLMRRDEPALSLNTFSGHVYEYKARAFFFLIACLGLAGFPITPTFLGEDLFFSHIHEDQLLLTFLVALNLIIAGLVLVRIYARIFLGPHIKPYHAVANRAS
jgi:hypothetical protein